jgi:polyhydroxybutyrate depolymerase
MASFSGLSETADERGFVVVYPAGTGIIDAARTFNGGNCCGRAKRLEVDEIAFVTAILNELPRLLAVDPRRIYATGMSNGALMAYLVADKLSQRIAAIAPVAGPMGLETCTPTSPVSVIHFHGVADDFVPFHGGVGKKSISKTNFFSVAHSLAAWVAANGCDTSPLVEELPPRVEDGTHVTRHTYRNARSGAEVVLYEIHGMGHTWPGRESRYSALGRVTQNVDANEVMWEFFTRHPRTE